MAKILNHIEQGVTWVYDRHSYDREKREALEKWAEKLLRTVSNDRSDVVASGNTITALASAQKHH